ncbi:KH domain-containing, RNA-binding, signal transduction-associated protein 1-like isoform X2 [Uloborus diversus]|uniref:KH domain-containing, RNA-binding, signal transduction-associated protein 1-like isoform X2 n=1 Tax=Uloborus diversus TaxID=327109 RepID=UPI00240A31C6|nr:KH domain-containing, RNA-binding, signal transduction-associated protein 1-like isoform X2 [Uloborus diversus]
MASKDSNADLNNAYLNQLMQEKKSLSVQYGEIHKLVQKEIDRVMNSEASDDPQRKDYHLDVNSGKQFRLKVKVHIPVDEHPNFNFVGKLLGPKGSSLQQLQEATQTKMAILGRGSMRDKKKEEELRNQGDPKYAHLNDELHVEITAYAAPAEAYRRMASAIAEVQRFLIPEYFDEMHPPQYMNDGKPKPPFAADGPSMRGGPPMPPRPMGPPMMAGREGPRRPALAQSTYASEGEEWGAPRPSPRRGGFSGAAPAPRPVARGYEEPANDYNSYGESYGDYNSGNAVSYYDYSADDAGYADGYADESRGPVRNAGGARGRGAGRLMTHPYGGTARRGY